MCLEFKNELEFLSPHSLDLASYDEKIHERKGIFRCGRGKEKNDGGIKGHIRREI